MSQKVYCSLMGNKDRRRSKSVLRGQIWVSMAVLGIRISIQRHGSRQKRDCGSAVVWVECQTEGKAKGLQNWWDCKGSQDTAQVVWKLPGNRPQRKWLESWIVSAWERLPRSSALEKGKNQAEPLALLFWGWCLWKRQNKEGLAGAGKPAMWWASSSGKGKSPDGNGKWGRVESPADGSERTCSVSRSWGSF